MMPHGQTAGDPRYELLRTPIAEAVRDLTDYADARFREHGSSLVESLPNFSDHYERSRGLAVAGRYHRNQMPVIDEADLQALKELFSTPEARLEWCEVCTVTPDDVTPSQCQIYCDKSINGTAASGVSGTLDFLKSNHLVVSRDNWIVDGHHRWLTANLIDPHVQLPAFRIKADLADALPLLLAFSDGRHERNG